MCGICGVIQIGGAPREVISTGALDRMTDVMSHRGPNDRGTYSAPGIALGVRRLSIVDVAGGHQPVASEDGTVVAIQNGELYNHLQLRSTLRAEGHELGSMCDTEILPHLFEREGTRFPEQLRGKFAIAIWDASRRRTVLARDRIGVKPLYWTQVGDLLVFASELKSILASGLVSPAVDAEAVDLYLTLGYVPGPRTILSGIRKVAPGSTLVVENGVVTETPYWAFPIPTPDPVARSIDEYAAELLEILREAVRDRLMSDVPVGAMLSGGIDSSLIVSLMAEASNRPVATFSVGFNEDPANELGDARSVAEAFGCEHHELALSIVDNALDLDKLVWHLDEPIADLSALGFDLLSQLASDHVSVALAGQGADELFGGYPKHRAAAAIGRLSALPDVARRVLGHAPMPTAKARRAVRAFGADDHVDRLLAMSGRLDGATRSAMYRGALVEVDPENARKAIERTLGGVNGDPLSTLLYLDARLALVDHMLLYFDKTSMAHSLEVRVPFLDHRLVEWAARLPPEMKVHKGVTKRVLKHAATDLIPYAAAHKSKVGFFRLALQTWLDRQLDGAAATRLLSPNAAYREFLDTESVRRLLGQYRRHRTEDQARLLYAILVLESWLETFLVQAEPKAASA